MLAERFLSQVRLAVTFPFISKALADTTIVQLKLCNEAWSGLG